MCRTATHGRRSSMNTSGSKNSIERRRVGPTRVEGMAEAGPETFPLCACPECPGSVQGRGSEEMPIAIGFVQGVQGVQPIANIIGNRNCICMEIYRKKSAIMPGHPGQVGQTSQPQALRQFFHPGNLSNLQGAPWTASARIPHIKHHTTPHTNHAASAAVSLRQDWHTTKPHQTKSYCKPDCRRGIM